MNLAWFPDFFKNIGSNYETILLYTKVEYLSNGQPLKLFIDLKEDEMKMSEKTDFCNCFQL